MLVIFVTRWYKNLVLKMNLSSLKYILLATAAFLLLSIPGHAQFYGNGTDPGNLKWYSIETPNYQVIYPKGTDSLALNYARLLEKYRLSAGYSIGMTPGSLQWRKMPVVLHAWNGFANGSVSWAPSRMDLYTVMQAVGSDPAPWDIQLTTHEPRHQAQLQLGYRGFLKPLSYIAGDASSPLGFLLYMDLALAEGDAVAAETGFGYGTRARTADFLDYYRVALDQGDYRSWDRWRYGSFKHETPDYYTLGYITIGGMRYFYDYPMFTADFLQRSLRRPFSFTPRNMMKTAAERSGKPFKETFTDILDKLNTQWREEAAQRGPFIPQEQVSHPVGGFPTSYAATIVLDGAIYLIRSSAVRGKELVRFVDGKEEILAPLNTSVQSLWNDDALGRLYWCETIGDSRWEMSHRSIIRYYDIHTGKITDLTHEGRLYCPSPSPDGSLISTVEYPYTGGNRITVVSGRDGSVVRSIPAPDGIQATETAWWKEDIYAIGITEKGSGIYKIGPDGRWETVFEPSLQKVVNLGFDARYLEWVSDRTGANEYYRYYPEEGKLVQMTSSRYGLTDVYEFDGYFYHVSQTLDGTMLFRTPAQDLRPREISYADVHTYPMEDALMAQERALGPVSETVDVPVSAPKRYYKLPHLFRIHTWLPFYTNYDNIESESMDFSYETVSLGATAFFQNTLGSMQGYVGYSAHPDPENGGPWMHSLHGKLTYSGLYPVIEASFDLGGDWARQYALSRFDDRAGGHMLSAGSFTASRPSYMAQLSAYIPLRFNKNGHLAGFVPKIDYTLSNNGFATNTRIWDVPGPTFDGLPTYYHFKTFDSGQNLPMHRLSASVRSYWMLPVADSGVYPRLGIGGEVGASFRPGLSSLFTPSIYAYAYGYLPGLWLPQGLRITGMYQHLLRSGGQPFGDPRASMLPRGFTASAATAALTQSAGNQWRLTADYAIPVYFGDLALGRFAYIKNFLLTPHFDATGLQNGHLWSAGADLTAELAHLLFINFDCSVGVSFSWLGGSQLSQAAQQKPYHVGMIFSFDL